MSLYINSWLLIGFRRSGTGKLVDFDYFAVQKEEGLKNSWEPIQMLGKYFLEKLEGLTPEKLESSKKLYLHLMEVNIRTVVLLRTVARVKRCVGFFF